MTDIDLGFEVVTGRRIKIPLRHTAVFGQTQESGKTTTLEGLISRSGLRGLAFVTKRGESSFHVMNPIAPYFRERTDWKFVAAILEATLSEKLKFQRAWIMKLCQAGHGKRGKTEYTWPAPRTLADVQTNVQTALMFATGMNESVYFELAEYLKEIIPQIDRLPYTTTLELQPGVNVMDLAAYDFPLQALVVRSSMEWIRKREHDCVLVVPESHKFAPKQRGSPVKLEAEDFIRESAALKNFLWIDCQDVAGVADVLLRQIGVWIFGVQRARHEIERTLDAIPEGLLARRPKAGEIATLSKGQFFVCWGREMWKVYVQPAWMTAAHAEAIAREEESVDTARSILKDYDREHKTNVKTKPVAQLTSRDAEGHQATDRAPGARAADGDVDGGADLPPVGSLDQANAGKEDSPMSITSWEQEYRTLKAEYDKLVDAHDKLAARLDELLKGTGRPQPGALPAPAQSDPAGWSGGYPGHMPSQYYDAIYEFVRRRWAQDPDRPAVYDLNFLYDEFKHRAEKDPGILALLQRRPELRVTVERQTIEARGDSLRGSLGILISEKFFDRARSVDDARAEVIRRGVVGKKTPSQQVSQAMEGLAELGFLTREADGYQAVPGMKVNILESVAQVARA